MTDTELIKALQNMKVETGSFVCFGCGHEHNCSTHGCAILRRAIEALSERWCDPEIELPPDEETAVLAIVSGRIHETHILIDAYQLAFYVEDEGWILENYPEATDIVVTHWMPLPEPPMECAHDEEEL